MINKNLIYLYINRIKKEDILEFAKRQDIILNNNELDLIYDYIKNKTDNILDDPEYVLEEIKDKLSYEVYLKILELYFKYEDYF